MLQIIPRPAHAVIDYIYGATALAAPKLLGFENNSRARTLSMVMGAAALASALTTKHEGGVAKIIPFNTHLKLDAASAALTLSAPWLLGFASDGKARNAIIGLGLMVAAAVAMSRPDNEYNPHDK
jgi:hypothetical protein